MQENINDPRRVLLFSHYSIIRAGLKHILGQVAGRFVLGEAKGMEDAMRKIEEESWDIVVADFALEGNLRLDLIKQLEKRKDRPSILIISPNAEDSYLKRSLLAGASGYLHWGEIELHLMKAIEQIGWGEKYVDPKLSGILMGEVQNQKLPHDCLSDREYQVLCQLSLGKRAVDVAKAMSLSPKTIHTYLKVWTRSWEN